MSPSTKSKSFTEAYSNLLHIHHLKQMAIRTLLAICYLCEDSRLKCNISRRLAMPCEGISSARHLFQYIVLRISFHSAKEILRKSAAVVLTMPLLPAVCRICGDGYVNHCCAAKVIRVIAPASFPSQLKLPLIGERHVLTIFAVDSRRKMENQRKHLCEFCHNKKAENNNHLFLDVKLWGISRIAALFWSVTELDGTDKYRPRRLLLRERYLSEFFCLSQVYLNQAYMLTIAS